MIDTLWELLLDPEWMGFRKLATLADGIGEDEERTRCILQGIGAVPVGWGQGELWQVPPAIQRLMATVTPDFAPSLN